MSEDLSDFFKLLSKEKKQKKEEFSAIVGDLDLGDVFAEVSNFKKLKKQKEIEEQKKIEEQKRKEDEELKKLVGNITLDNLFEEVKTIKKVSKEKEKKKKEKEKEALHAFENFLYNEEITETKEVQKAVEEWIEEVVEEPKQELIQEELIQEVIEEPTKEVQEQQDPLTPLTQDFVTFKDLQEHYRLFINRVQQQLSSLGGGGETRLEFLDDVDRNSAKTDGYFLQYQASTGKFVGAAVTGGGGGVVGSAGTWAVDSVGINTVKNVGIGTTAKDGYKLYVEGDARVTGILTVGPASVTIDGINDRVTSQSFVGNLTGSASSVGGVSSSFLLDYNNFTNTPTIPSDTGDLTNSVGFVTSSIVVGYATEGYVDNLVAISTFSGDYGDLTNTPTIPSDTGDLTNSVGFVTSSVVVGYATEGYVDASISNLIDNAPDALNTLNELALALGDDENFATTVTNSLASKANLSGANFTGIVTASTFVGNLTGTASTASFATTSYYLEGQSGSYYLDYNNLTNTPTSLVLPDGLISSVSQTITTTLETTIDSFSSSAYRSAKYQIQVTRGSEYQITEISIVHDGTTSYGIEYATVKTGSTLSTFSTDIDGSNVVLQATPSSNTSTTFKLVRTLIEL